MAVGDAYVFPGFLTPVLTQLFFPNPPTTFLTCFCRGERRNYTGKKSRLNRVSNSQPPGYESVTLTTEPRAGLNDTLRKEAFENTFPSFPKMFSIGLKTNLIIRTMFNSLPIEKILDWSKFKAFADNKINVG